MEIAWLPDLLCHDPRTRVSVAILLDLFLLNLRSSLFDNKMFFLFFEIYIYIHVFDDIRTFIRFFFCLSSEVTNEVLLFVFRLRGSLIYLF